LYILIFKSFLEGRQVDKMHMSIYKYAKKEIKKDKQTELTLGYLKKLLQLQRLYNNERAVSN
jgi:hypothetical protein